jgi:hypothetical protein
MRPRAAEPLRYNKGKLLPAGEPESLVRQEH